MAKRHLLGKSGERINQQRIEDEMTQAPAAYVGEELYATVEDNQVDEFVAAVAKVVEAMHGSAAYWSDALGLARRAIRV